MQTELKTTENLFGQVTTLIKKYNEIARLTGDNFNIFKTLGLSTSEVRLHSALLAELLNPKGSHGLKEKFLKLFIQKIVMNNEGTIDLSEIENATVVVEKWVGYIDVERNIGGYIDILIQLSNDRAIIIENKIYAGDQEGQLRRYHNFNKNAIIVYLTLDGKEAVDHTTKNQGNPDNQIKPIYVSYKEGIRDWLELCKKEAVDYPIIRETITQYINLIKHLTNQTMSIEMNKELVKMIAGNPEYIKSAEEIAGVWDDCKFQIIKSLKEDIEKIASELGLECRINDKLGNAETEFQFYKADWCYSISFYFEKKFENLWVGIDNISNKTPCPDEIKEKLKVHFVDYNGSTNQGTWIWASYFNEWEEIISWADVKNLAPKAIKETTEKILDKLKTFRP